MSTSCRANSPWPDAVFGRQRVSPVQLRRKTRTLALQSLYEIDCTTHAAEDVLARYITQKALTPDAASFLNTLVNGVLAQHAVLDRLIHQHAPEWPVDQISVVDRNILRIAIFEMTSIPETPLKVAINEAVELAKIYGSASAARFVNGVLGAVATHHVDLMVAEQPGKPDSPPKP